MFCSNHLCRVTRLISIFFLFTHPNNCTTVAARKRVSRRLTFDEDKTSPVSGTLIRELADGEEIPMYQTGKASLNSYQKYN